VELEERIRQAVSHLKKISGGDAAEHLIDEEFVINELVKFRHAELQTAGGTRHFPAENSCHVLTFEYFGFRRLVASETSWNYELEHCGPKAANTGETGQETSTSKPSTEPQRLNRFQ
jgi:hypothetical protein